MRIQHNIAALNSHRQMGVNNTNTNKNLEKLSSGYRINRAGDDAAGLAISEKMRAQIRGLSQATSNSQDGVSLIQTAEGSLQETESILQRMRELAVQSSNGIYDDQDRAALDKETQDLKSEIDRISTATNFNGIALLDGSLGGGVNSAKIKAGNMGSANLIAGGDINLTGGIDGMTVKFVSGGTEGAAWSGNELTVTLKNEATTKSAEDIQKLIDAAKANAPTGAENVKISIGGTGSITTTTTAEATGATATFEGFKESSASTTLGGKDVTVTSQAGSIANGSTITIGSAAAEAKATWGADGNLTITLDSRKTSYSSAELNALIQNASGKNDKVYADDGLKISYEGNLKTTDLDPGTDTVFTLANGAGTKGDGLVFQIGANGVEDQRVELSIDDMSTKGLGVDGLSVSTQKGANDAIDLIDKAIESVSMQRASLGGLQNRLEHTIANLGVTSENLTSSESRIRDVDMASEMMEFTKNNILSQAAQAMLAQANQVPQGILQLLR